MDSVTLGTSDLKVKCLTCKNTYEVENVRVTMVGVIDPDTDEFVCFEVDFKFGPGAVEAVETDEVYLQDFLCTNQRCSVFGRVVTDPLNVFAFPCVVRTGRGTWVTKPDSTGSHFAMQRLTEASA